MRLNARISVSVSALFLLGAFGATTAYAQQSGTPASDSPTFTKEVIQDKPEGTPDVEGAPAPIPTVALVVPPSPRIVTGGPGSIAIRGGEITSDSPYAMKPASATSMRINSNFGWRGGRVHKGVDFQASYGDSVGASMSGVVAFAGVKRGYGNLIVVDHGNGVSTYYAHLSAMWVSVGQSVSPGQVIGAIGVTGRSSGPHLHYEVRVNGEAINPAYLISFTEGQVWVNGKPFEKDEDDEPVPGGEVKPISDARSTAAEGTRPRRVSADPSKSTVIIASNDTMTAY